MSRITITVDEIVLRGFGPEDRIAVVEGFRAELLQMLANPAARAIWTHARHVPILKLGRLPFQSGLEAGQVFGTQMVRALGKQLGRR